MKDLEFYSTPELLAELERRHICNMYIGLRAGENNRETFGVALKGSVFTLNVMLQALQCETMKAVQGHDPEVSGPLIVKG